MSPQTGKVLTRFWDSKIARVSRVRWRGRERGELTLSRGELCICEKKKNLQFWKTPAVSLRIPTVLINMVAMDDEGRLVIHWIDKDDVPFVELITISNRGEAETFITAVERVLEELGGEGAQGRLERAERERKELEERERQDEFRMVQAERELVWRTTGQIWGVCAELLQIITVLRSEDWKLIDSSWRKAKSLGRNSIIGLSESLESFLPSLESKSADETYRDTLTFFVTLAVSLETLKSERAAQEKLLEKYGTLPRWSHLSYFLLFTLLYTETVLCYNADDIATVNDNLVRLGRTATVLDAEFGLELESQISVFGAALETGDENQIRKTGRDMENYIAGSIESKTESWA